MELIASPDMAGLKQFMIRWFGEARPEWGMDPGEVPSFVPEPLAELYRFAGRWPSNSPYDHLPDSPAIFQNQDVLVRVADLDITDGMVTFLDENQGVWHGAHESSSTSMRLTGKLVGMREYVIHPFENELISEKCQPTGRR